MSLARLITRVERDATSDTGTHWRVREAIAVEVPGAPSPSCLIFDCGTVCRRLWHYPERWADLIDAELLALMDRLRARD